MAKKAIRAIKQSGKGRTILRHTYWSLEKSAINWNKRWKATNMRDCYWTDENGLFPISSPHAFHSLSLIFLPFQGDSYAAKSGFYRGGFLRMPNSWIKGREWLFCPNLGSKRGFSHLFHREIHNINGNCYESVNTRGAGKESGGGHGLSMSKTVRFRWWYVGFWKWIVLLWLI